MKKIKIILIMILLSSCSKTAQITISPGECVIGEGMAVWKLLRKENDVHLFLEYPLEEDSPVRSVKDLATFKKVECPS